MCLEREDGHVLRIDAASGGARSKKLCSEPQLGQNYRDKVQPLFSAALTRYEIHLTLAIMSQFLKGLCMLVLLSVATFN